MASASSSPGALEGLRAARAPHRLDRRSGGPDRRGLGAQGLHHHRPGDPLLEAWASRHARELHWTPPAAGSLCLFSYTWPLDSVTLSDRLIRDWSTMIVPGAHFSAERHLRIGFGMPSRVLDAGLAAIDRLLVELGT